jgi:hypothetical protein
MTRLATALLLAALQRRVESAGGFATIICKGDATGGVILVQCLDRGRFSGFFERITDLNGRSALHGCGPAAGTQDAEIAVYIERRRRSDPDLWVIELDIAEAERFAAETLCID